MRPLLTMTPTAAADHHAGPVPQALAAVPGPFRRFGRHARWVVPGVLCLVVTNVLAQSIPWIVKRTVDAIGRQQGVGHLALLLAGLAALQAVIRVASRIFIFNAGREAEYELRRDLFARLCQLDRELYRRLRIGDLMSRLTNDLSSVRMLLSAGTLQLVNTVFAYAVALPLMLHLDAWLTLWALAPYPLLLLAARTFARGIYARSRALQLALAEMSSRVEEDLAGIAEVKGHALEDVRAASLAEASRRYLDASVSLARWRAGLLPVVGLGSGLSLLVVLWVGGARVISGALGLGDLVAFTLYVGLLTWPTLSIGWMLSLWERGLAAWQRLAELLAARSPLETSAEAPAPAPDLARPRAPTLELRGLEVASDGRRLLEAIDLVVPAGGLCAVVGRVGSGKSTLAEAVARLVEVSPGTLLIDGVDVTTRPVAEVRALIGYAPQSAFLFSATIAENIALGLPATLAVDSDDARRRIERAALAAGLGPDLARFPEGLQTVVGERGITVSGGQRQRIALARALVSDRPLLILDDSLSSVDAETERVILEGLGGELAGRTTLLVSHRLSALQHADQVVVLDRGRVVERGRHAELLARGGLYAELYRRQLAQELLA